MTPEEIAAKETMDMVRAIVRIPDASAEDILGLIRAALDRANDLSEAYRRRLIRMHGHEDAACPAASIRPLRCDADCENGPDCDGLDHMTAAQLRTELRAIYAHTASAR